MNSDASYMMNDQQPSTSQIRNTLKSYGFDCSMLGMIPYGQS